MKRMFNAALALMMVGVVPSVQVHAQEMTIQSAVADLQYSLNVEWDQKDVGFKKEAIKAFNAKVAQLSKSGLTREQLVAALKTNLDAQSAKDVDGLAAYAKEKNLSAQETQALVMDYVSKNASGASWTSQATVTVVVIGVILLLAIAIATADTVVVDTYDPYYYDCYYDYYYDEYYCY